MRYQIKYMGIGEILDMAITLLKDHFCLLFGIVGVTTVPINLIFGLWITQMVMNDPTAAVANP